MNSKNLLWSLWDQESDLIKSWCTNKATTYQACEQDFVSIHKVWLGGVHKSKKVFSQKKETKRMMRSLPKSKKKGSGSITNILI